MLPTWQSSSRDPAFDQQTFFFLSHAPHTRTSPEERLCCLESCSSLAQKEEEDRRKGLLGLATKSHYTSPSIATALHHDHDAGYATTAAIWARDEL